MRKLKTTIEVSELSRRLRALEAVSTITVKVQVEQLAKAEKLRQAAVALVKSCWQHRCADRVGGCTAVSAEQLEALINALKGLPRFHRNVRMPAAVRKALAKKG